MVKYINRADCYSCGKSIEFSFDKKHNVFYSYRAGKIRWYCKKCFNKLGKRLKGSIELEPICLNSIDKSEKVKPKTSKVVKKSETLVDKRVNYWKKLAKESDK